MTSCHGNGDTHCCYINGVECQYLIKNVNDRKWSCGLLTQYENWDTVYTSQQYTNNVQPYLIAAGSPDCGKWVGPGCCFGKPVDDPEVVASYLEAVERPGTPVKIRAAILELMDPGVD